MFDITPYLNPNDPWILEDNPKNVKEYYQFKFNVTAILQPKRILEFGFRAGYSASAFLAGSPEASYHGVDADIIEHGGTPGMVSWAMKNLPENFPGRKITFCILNTQTETPEGEYDFIHIDADHSYEGCTRDLDTAEKLGTCWLLVDDVDFLQPVDQAVKDWLAKRDYPSLYLPSYRGDMLIRMMPK